MLYPPRFLESDLPAMARPGFRAEWAYYCLISVAACAVEGNLIALIAKKSFDAPDWLTSLIWGIPISANLFNLIWGVLLRGRRIVPALLVLSGVLALLVASTGLVDPAGGARAAAIFAAQAAGVHLMMSGLLTLRVSVWRANYPAPVRARITSRIQTLRMLILLVGTAAISWALDHDPRAYRLLFPLLAVGGLLSLIPAARLRIRQEGRELRAWAEVRAASPRSGPAALRAGVQESLGILRRDPVFARYMLGQFLMGSANFLTDPVLLIILAGPLAFTYSQATQLLFTVPTLLILVSIHRWAGYFDGVGVIRFRVINSQLWIGAYVCTVIAALLVGGATLPTAPGLIIAAIVLLAVGRVLNGICKGGGNLAWSLGHLHFAAPHDASLYMGIHVALTGLRGLVMPLLGVYLYSHVGRAYFFLPLGLSIAAHLVFRAIDRAERAAGAGRGGGELAQS